MKSERIIDTVWEATHTGKDSFPWIVQGVKTVNAGATETNPTPTEADLIGEICYLPYTVPQNHVLVIRNLQCYDNAVLYNWFLFQIKLNRPGVSNVVIASISKQIEYDVVRYDNGIWVPEGSELSIDLINKEVGAADIRFLVSGILVKV